MVVKVTKIDDRKFLCINHEVLEIADYNLKSSADGSTELSLIIKGNVSEFDSLAILKE